jgi:hypothetical protein
LLNYGRTICEQDATAAGSRGFVRVTVRYSAFRCLASAQQHQTSASQAAAACSSSSGGETSAEQQLRALINRPSLVLRANISSSALVAFGSSKSFVCVLLDRHRWHTKVFFD